MAPSRISFPFLVFILCTTLMVTVSHAARVRELGEAEAIRRNLLDNGLGHTPQMG
jgi:alpha-galactosidase